MRTLLLLLVCISIRCSCYAQDAAKTPNQSISKNTLFAEVWGNSIFYSINYDRILINQEKWKFTGRLGFGYYYVRDRKYSVLSFPSEFTFLIGRSKHFFETGLGVSDYVETSSREYYYFPDDKALHSVYLFCRFGYRYQRPQGGFFLKAGLTPLVALTDAARYPFNYSEFFGVFGGVGIGYTFKQKRSK